MKQRYTLVALTSILILKSEFVSKISINFSFNFLLVSDVVQCLRVSRLDIISPTPVKDGSRMTLMCLYNLSRGEQFKGIEWFKDDNLFYLYTPGNDDIFSDRTASSTDQFEVNVSKCIERISLQIILIHSILNL